MRPSLFLSASVPTGKQYKGWEAHYESARPQWIRDAVLAVTRAAFEADIDLVFGAHPAISPIVLMVAREFPTVTPPRVAVFQSQFFAGQMPTETLELADGKLGSLITTPISPSKAAPDREASLQTMRGLMFKRTGLVAGMFIGGMDGVATEAMLFKSLNPKLPTYAVASSGGAAADLLAPKTANALYGPDDFRGHPDALIDEKELSLERVGYTKLADLVIGAIRAGLDSGAIQPRP